MSGQRSPFPQLATAEARKLTAAILTPVRLGAQSQAHPQQERCGVELLRPGAQFRRVASRAPGIRQRTRPPDPGFKPVPATAAAHGIAAENAAQHLAKATG